MKQVFFEELQKATIMFQLQNNLLFVKCFKMKQFQHFKVNYVIQYNSIQRAQVSSMDQFSKITYLTLTPYCNDKVPIKIPEVKVLDHRQSNYLSFVLFSKFLGF